MTKEQIAELRRLDAEAGTKAPWGFGDGWGPDDRKDYVCLENLGDVDGAGHIGNLFDPADGRLAVAARNALARLLDEREALLAVLRDLLGQTCSGDCSYVGHRVGHEAIAKAEEPAP